MLSFGHVYGIRFSIFVIEKGPGLTRGLQYHYTVMVPGTRYLVPVPGTCYQVPGTRNELLALFRKTHPNPTQPTLSHSYHAIAA